MECRDKFARMALRFGPALLIVMSFVAILLGIIFHATTIDEVKYRDPPAQHFDPNIVMDEKLNDLVWFLQVTDLHLSDRGHYERKTDFSEFAKTYVKIINPDAVLVTGDITDGIKPNTTIDTGPQLGEWLAYSNAISDAGTLNKTIWLDIRGNHDNFNVYRPEDSNNLYRKYSIQGKKNPRNYMYILEKEGKNYSFIGVDEVQTPGLKIPFNFLGIVKDEDLSQLKEFKEVAQRSNSHYRVWFAHYPTSSIVSPGEGLRNMVDGPYLCGHFHTIGNLVMKMHATQQPGFAEVELGDWKHNRRLRLASIDHQLFNLVDLNFKQFPIALMTNPKAAEYSMPKYEPINRIMNSTHIRVIAFSNASLSKVQVSLDGREKQELTHSSGPLFALSWNPKEYATGLHSAQITVTDSEGKIMTYKQSFSLDGSKEDFALAAKILLRTYFRSSVMSIFFFIVVVCSFPLLILRIVVYNHKDSGIKRHYKGTFLYNLHLLCKIDRIFWWLLLIPIWMSIGPQFIGYMVDEAIGVCFVWGVLIDGTFVHTGITYNVGSIFLLFVHVPSVVLITNQISSCYEASLRSSEIPSIKNFRLLLQVVLTILQLWMAFLLYSAYGLLSLFTSFPFVWCIPIYYNCWYQCTTLGKSDFIKFDEPYSLEEQQALTGQKTRDDKSSSSDHSTC